MCNVDAQWLSARMGLLLECDDTSGLILLPSSLFLTPRLLHVFSSLAGHASLALVILANTAYILRVRITLTKWQTLDRVYIVKHSTRTAFMLANLVYKGVESRLDSSSHLSQPPDPNLVSVSTDHNVYNMYLKYCLHLTQAHS
jgi:hypothetical protein